MVVSSPVFAIVKACARLIPSRSAASSTEMHNRTAGSPCKTMRMTAEVYAQAHPRNSRAAEAFDRLFDVAGMGVQ